MTCSANIGCLSFFQDGFPSEQMSHRLPGTPVSIVPPDDRTHIYVNLAKLEHGTLRSLQDEATAIDNVSMPQDSVRSEKVRLEVPPRRAKKKKDENVKAKRLRKDVKQFLGPVVPTEALTPDLEADEDEELPIINFRLKGTKRGIELCDPTTDMFIDKRDAGRLIREAEYHYHKEQEMKPEPVVHPLTQPSVERRLFKRMHGTMGLSCLRAVEQAYKDRAKAERRYQKLETVLNMRDQRDAAKERIRIFNEEKRSKTMKEREKEAKTTAGVLEKRELNRIGYLDKSGELRNKSSHFTKHRRGELTFISDFNTQNTSVSNALLRHDRLARKEDKLQEKNDFVQGQKAMEQDQKEVVQKYLQHRQLMRQTESALARSTLDTKMLQEANETLMNARTRVAQQKARSKTALMYTAPQTTMLVLPPLEEERRQKVERGVDRWGTGLADSAQNLRIPQAVLSKQPPATAAPIYSQPQESDTFTASVTV